MCACFVTADLYERTTTDNEPGFGEMNDMVSFTGYGASYGGRGVACNAPASDGPAYLLITMIPCIWSGITINASISINGK